MLPSDASHKLVDFIFLVGEPPLDISSIERLGDLEAGKLLLDWLAGQLGCGNNLELKLEGDSHDEEERNRRSFASIRDIVLEKDEALALDHIKSSETSSITERIPPVPPDYMPPSRLRKYTEYINEETSLVQREADLLRARISQTKEASKKIAHSIKLLQRAVFDLDSKARGSEERLSELCINADTTVTSTLNGAQGLLRDLGYFGRIDQNQDSVTASDENKPKNPTAEGAPDLESARDLLLNTQNELSSITIDLRQNLKDFSLLREQAGVKVQDLGREVERLQNVFHLAKSETNSGKAMKARSGSARTDDHMVTKELEDICALLEREVALRESGDNSGDNALEALLSELDEVHRMGSVLEGGPAVEEMLHQAWSLDQAAILKLHEEVLDEALSSLDSAIVPLERLHASLSRLTRCVQDAEAVLEALGEELEEIYSNDCNGKVDNKDIHQEEDLERQLKHILGDLKGGHSSDIAPVMLLTRDDILAELRSLRARYIALEVLEGSWANDLVHTYSIRPLHPALTEIHAHSPLNTAPPFAFPADVRDLEAQTRTKTTELQNLANSLEEEVRETFAKQSNLKRLSAFVNKWSETTVTATER